MGSPIHARHLPGKEPDSSPRLRIAERWHGAGAPSWHRGISIISRLQEKPPPPPPAHTHAFPQPPSSGCQVWAGRKQLSSFQRCNPCAHSMSKEEGAGSSACCQHLPAPSPSSHLSRFTAVPATSGSRAWPFAQRSQKEEVPSLKSKPRQTIFILPFGGNLEGWFVKPASAPCFPLDDWLVPAPKGRGNLSPPSRSSAEAMGA